MLASSAALLALLFPVLRHAAGADTPTVITNLVYPALDVPLLGTILLGYALLAPGHRTRWGLLAAGGVANVIGDCVAVFPSLVRGLLGNALNAVAWPTSLLLIASALWLAPGSGRPPRENQSSGFLIPTVASLLSLAILLLGIVAHVSRVGMGAALLALLIAGLRYGLALRHSRALTAERERDLQAAAQRERQARDALEEATRELHAQSQRDVFGTKLGDALEMADEEDAAYEVVERAIAEISVEHPAELLLADSSRAHPRRGSSNPQAGHPGCPVESPFACVAVRRGQPVTFESSEELNACPKLRGRMSGPCSAVCVPVGFMGRALGVLHATGPEGSPPTGDQLAQMTTLATQAGARIGTVRAFEKTQLQASTDGLTGLTNRRRVEAEIRELLRAGTPFALTVADLDRFKTINDTYGHEAGDRVLRFFAQVAGAALREGDLFARWGGEEVTIVMPGVFDPVLGAALEQLLSLVSFARVPALSPSAFGGGWWNYLDRDLVPLLGGHERDPLSRGYCGTAAGGRRMRMRVRLGRCGAEVIGSLEHAVAQVSAQQGPDMAMWKVPATCPVSDATPQGCDQIQLTTGGGVDTPPIPWQNRPTYQQAVEVTGQRPRPA